MKIKRPFGGVAVAVLATGVLAATPAAAEFAPLNPGMVAALQRDLGLSHDQAITRLGSEEAAGRIARSITGALGDRLGGVSYDAASGKARIGVTDASLLDRVRAGGAEAELVRFTARQLDSTVDSLNANEPAAPDAVTGWGVDAAANRITLTVLRGQRAVAEAYVAKSGVDRSAVTIAETAEKPAPFYDVRGGDAYYIGSSSRCSVGFSVRGGFLTAGHCAALTGGGALSGYNHVAMGRFGKYKFPGEDYASATVNSNWTPVGQINNGTRVSGTTEAAVGASVCKAGSTTGWTCGTIQAKNQTVRYPQGAVRGMTQTSAHAEGGDSGGSFISGNQAQGLTSGGDSSTTYFYLVSKAISATGTSIVLG
ncbi:S1 family peptidase [Amycolatopsis samaneae]|uniref:S1 family peptidase n=1 Tax=Amycolatopsis samaneae TaxID=664691 RepID=A0ABW5GGG6_9PSEU